MSVLLQPPPTAEELALKEQVTQVLTSQGVLAKLKAELRAAVFEVMHEREGFTKKMAPMVPKLSDFPLETRTTALSLIVECLHFFHWEHTIRVLLAETDAEDEQHDDTYLAKKLGLTGASSLKMPTLFKLIEAQGANVDQTTSFMPELTWKHKQLDEDVEGYALDRDTKAVEQEKAEFLLPRMESDRTEFSKDEVKKDDEVESSAEMEESMAQEVPSESELGESNYEDEESQDRSITNKQPSIDYSKQPQEKSQYDIQHQFDDRESDDDDAVSLAAPPPAPAILPTLPPLLHTPNSTDILTEEAEDEFDAEEEAERLRKLDAALQAMEAEDDTGTLQQLKASLQVELQEQDSFVSSGGLGRADEEDAEAESDNGEGREGDDDGYDSSDFEMEEEVASDISEEMESMPDLSDREDESESNAADEVEPPHALRNDTRVENEDALNSYDYIEDVLKTGW